MRFRNLHFKELIQREKIFLFYYPQNNDEKWVFVVHCKNIEILNNRASQSHSNKPL